MGRPLCENFLTAVEAPRGSRRKSDWFRCKKISRKLKYLKFKCEQSERYFLSDSIDFTNLSMSSGKNFARNRRKARLEIRLKNNCLSSLESIWIRITSYYWHECQKFFFALILYQSKRCIRLKNEYIFPMKTCHKLSLDCTRGSFFVPKYTW